MTSECPECPPYVIRCAHWEGVKVVVVDGNRIDRCQDCQRRLEGRPRAGRFTVTTFPTKSQWWACEVCGQEHIWSGALDRAQFGDDEPSALTEFQTRAAHLLERA